ncbi:MAG: tRNA pseudouridine(55) synthase TruB [Bacillota bacterium]
MDKFSGFLAIIKPPGMTSHDVVHWLRRLTGLKRIGHTGTLDPDAAGVLVLAMGRATRLTEYVTAQDKQYRAEVYLGTVTDTMDLSGQTLATVDASAVGRRQVEEACASLTGTSHQVPPLVSAVKVAGRRLYEYARAGEEITPPVRTVHIGKLEVVAFRPGKQAVVWLEIHCSKGTYVRTLAHDIGERLGVGGSLAFLVRTASGQVSLADGRILGEIESAVQRGHLPELFLPVTRVLPGLPVVVAAQDAIEPISHGIPFQEEWVASGRLTQVVDLPHLVVDAAGGPLAVVAWSAQRTLWRYRKVLAGS